MPPRGSVARPRNSRRSTAAGSRRGCAACRRRRPSVTARCCRCAASIIASCIGRRARHGLDRDRRGRRASCSASPARRRTSTAGSAISSGARPSAISKPPAARAAGSSASHQAHLGARPVEPLGLVLDHRRAVVLLAAHPGAAFRAGLSRRARGRASGRDEPFAAVLAAGERHLPGRHRAKAWLDVHGTDLHRYGMCRRSGALTPAAHDAPPRLVRPHACCSPC